MPHDAEAPNAPSERQVIAPIIDHDEAGRIYDDEIHRFALLAGLAGALVFGWIGYAMAAGSLPIAGLGQWAVSGPGVGAFTGTGVGAAAGGLGGALVALYRRPRRRPADDLAPLARRPDEPSTAALLRLATSALAATSAPNPVPLEAMTARDHA